MFSGHSRRALRPSARSAWMRSVRPPSSWRVPKVPETLPLAVGPESVKASMETPSSRPERWAAMLSIRTGGSAGVAPRSTASRPVRVAVQAGSAPGPAAHSPASRTALPPPR